MFCVILNTKQFSDRVMDFNDWEVNLINYDAR